MKNRTTILLFIIFGLSMMCAKAQPVMDTICLSEGFSNFAVPYQTGLSYQWQVNGGQIISKPDSNDIRVEWGNRPGIYKISVVTTNIYGCPGDTSHYAVELVAPTVANAKGAGEKCIGDVVTLESTIQGRFEWSGGQTTPSISFVVEKDTMVSLYAINAPCENDTFHFFVEAYDAPIAAMNYVPDTMRVGSSENFFYNGAGASGFEWQHNSNSISYERAVNIEFTSVGEHEIMQVVTNGNCTDTVWKKIYVEDIFKVFIPNAFSPNGDGVNDHFTFDGVGIKSYHAQIYNRWGEMIFQWTDTSPVPGWDGTNSGRDSKIDAYIYKIIVEDMSGEKHFYTDQFSLIR